MLVNIKLNLPLTNIVTTLRTSLSKRLSNCPGKRNFLVLKCVKGYLKNFLCDLKLNFSNLLNIESEITKKVYYNKQIDDFIVKKFRKNILIFTYTVLTIVYFYFLFFNVAKYFAPTATRMLKISAFYSWYPRSFAGLHKC